MSALCTLLLLAIHPSQRAAAVQYPVGWNLISGPTGSTLSGATGSLYTLQPGDRGYESLSATSPLTGGFGYWAFFPAGGSITLGRGASTYAIDLVDGQWAMLGNPSATADGILGGVQAAYTYTPAAGYQSATSVAAGQGAWVIGSGAASISTARPATDSGQPPSAPVSFTVDPGVSSSDEANIRAGIQFARTYLPQLFGTSVQQRVSVEIHAGVDPANPTNFGGYFGNHRIVYTLGAKNWQNFSSRQKQTFGAWAYLAILVNDWSQGRQFGIAPAWIYQGTTQLVAHTIVGLAGGSAVEQDVGCAESAITRLSDIELRSLEDQSTVNQRNTEGRPAYQLMEAAAAHLVKRSNITTIRSFFVQLAHQDWQSAFLAAFGVDVDTFYTEWRQYQASLVRTSDNPCGRSQTPAPIPAFARMPPGIPTRVSVTAIDRLTLLVTWAASDGDLEGYEIRDVVNGNTVATVGGTADSIQLTVYAGSQYCVQVYAFNNAGYSAASNEACATTPP